MTALDLKLSSGEKTQSFSNPAVVGVCCASNVPAMFEKRVNAAIVGWCQKAIVDTSVYYTGDTCGRNIIGPILVELATPFVEIIAGTAGSVTKALLSTAVVASRQFATYISSAMEQKAVELTRKNEKLPLNLSSFKPNSVLMLEDGTQQSI